jgi:hypothetical protein
MLSLRRIGAQCQRSSGLATALDRRSTPRLGLLSRLPSSPAVDELSRLGSALSG